ncbi:BatD family protein [Cupriavidus campinensis]
MTPRHCLAALAVCAATLAHAAAPTARVRVIGQQPVVAGQSVQVEVTILAPNFFLSAPAFPALQVPGAVVTMPDDRGVNSTEIIDGVSYAGIRKTYVFTPQTGGDFVLPAPVIRLTYAGDDGKPRDGTVTLPPTTIRAGAQRAQATGTATLPAGRVAVTQRFDRPVEGKDAHLRAGDALVRTVTIFATGTPAMMIEPPDLPSLQGVRQFRADPRLQDAARDPADPGGDTGGRRTESITYVFERSGRYTLPPVRVAWYDAASGQRAESAAPAVTVEVGRAAGGLGLAPGGAPWRLIDWLAHVDWLRTGFAAAGLAGIAYLLFAWRVGRIGKWMGGLQRAMAWLRRLVLHRGLPPLNP